MVGGLLREHPLEREHGALVLAGVVRGDAQQIVELEVAGARALLRQQKLVGFLRPALREQALRGLGQLIGQRGAAHDGEQQRGSPSRDPSSYPALPPAPCNSPPASSQLAGGESLAFSGIQDRTSRPSDKTCTRSPTKKARLSTVIVRT